VRGAGSLSLRIDNDGAVLRLTLDRPEKHNALDGPLLVGLTAAFADLGSARAVVLRGAGPSFSAGADIDEMRAGLMQSDEERLVDARRWLALLEAMDSCPVPVVAGAHGNVFGGACGVLACCDIVVAAPGTRFAFSEVKLGLVPAVVSPFVVSRLGPTQARALFVTGERFDTDRALRAGLVTEVASDLDAGVERVVAEILAAGPEAVRVAKRIARAPIDKVGSLRLIADLRASDEAQEGMRAFLERRNPDWRP
jgi:methylglutaconyl-CoA hydratase